MQRTIFGLSPAVGLSQATPIFFHDKLVPTRQVSMQADDELVVHERYVGDLRDGPVVINFWCVTIEADDDVVARAWS